MRKSLLLGLMSSAMAITHMGSGLQTASHSDPELKAGPLDYIDTSEHDRRRKEAAQAKRDRKARR